MKENIDVSIIMGSDSDLPIMKDCVHFLDQMNISYEVKILSVHRTPERATEYAKELKERNIKVIIAGAGGAAHLPGVFAAMVPTVPVIGIPIQTKSLGGVDSLYSIVQMPSRNTCCNSCNKWRQECSSSCITDNGCKQQGTQRQIME